MARRSRLRGIVSIYVASYNTAAATELCVRTMRETAGASFRLTVGDSGSTDASQAILGEMARRGWLAFEVRPGRRHAEWLVDWLRRDDESRYLLFSDSDIQFRREGWLREMLHIARSTGAAAVYTEHLRQQSWFEHPFTKESVHLAERPAPWLLLADRDQLRRITVGFEEVREVDPSVPEGIVVYDVGAKFFDEAKRQGLTLVLMPRRFQRSYRHYAGLSWATDDSAYARQKRKYRKIVAHRLAYIRLRQDGHGSRAAVLAFVAETRAALVMAARHARRLRQLRHPDRVLAKARQLTGIST